MPDQKTIWATVIVAALLVGVFEAIKEINQIGWRNMNRKQRISIAFYPIAVPLAIFVGIFWCLVAFVAESVVRIIKAFAGITKKVVNHPDSNDRAG
jgi:uncharacterized membrane protein